MARVKLDEWELTWASSQHDRYDTPMLENAEKLLKSSGLKLTGSWGGSALNVDYHDKSGSDNGYAIKASELEAHSVARTLSETVGYKVAVRRCEP